MWKKFIPKNYIIGILSFMEKIKQDSIEVDKCLNNEHLMSSETRQYLS